MNALLLILSDIFVVTDFLFNLRFSPAFCLVSKGSASFYFDVTINVIWKLQTIANYCVTYFIFSDLSLMVLATPNYTVSWIFNARSNNSLMFYKNLALKNFGIFTGKRLYCSLLYNKIAGSRSVTLLRRDSGKCVFL